jgi:putative CocE/NonD family hydrolase
LHDDLEGFTPNLNVYSDLIEDGYIFVFQDIRGRYSSQGQFIMMRNPCAPQESNCVDEGTDANDTIRWLIKNVPNNDGQVGILGISYGGWLTVMAMLHPDPAIKAVSEQAAMTDVYLGDDFFHNGAFRLSESFAYVSLMETTKSGFDFPFSKYDTYDWYLNDLGPLANANEMYFHLKLPTWNNFVDHPNYDEFWQKKAVPRYLTEVTVPILNVAGWWDQEDFYGPIKIYETLRKHDTKHWNYLVVGPWRHGEWSEESGYRLGDIEFGTDTGRYFRKNLQAPWFAYWLKHEGHLPSREVLTFQTGTDEWKTYDQWPPHENIIDQKLYFHSEHVLSFDAPTNDEKDSFDSYVSDPDHPVPFRHLPIAAWRGWTEWLVQDQRFVYLRPDVLAYETSVLSNDAAVTGDIVAHLYVSTTGTDGDWIVKLIDVYPELNPNARPSEYASTPPPVVPTPGYQLMVADEVFRARFRDSFEHPEPLVPAKATPITIDLHTNDHCFLKGHRIMVQIQSTWFPLIDRNPQKFVPNIFKAKPSDYQKATVRIYHSDKFPSCVEIPVAKG